LTAAQGLAGERSSGGVALALAFCFAAAMCEGLDIQAAGVAAAGIKAAFEPTPAALGLFLAAGNFGLLFGAVAGGRIADRVGRKAVLVAAVGVFGLCSALTALAWDMPSLIAIRVLTGLGLGGAMPNLIALAADVSPERSRNSAIALTYIGMPLGGAVASSIIFVAASTQWRSVFLLGAVAPLVIAPLMVWLLPGDRPAAASQVRTADPRVGFRAIFADGRLPRTLLLWLAFLLSNLTLHLMLSWLPLLLQGRGLLRSDAALAQIGFNAGGAAAALLAGMVLDTRWRRASIGLSVAALPLALFLLANAPAAAAQMFALAVLLGAAILAASVILYGMAGGFYPPQARGAGVGSAIGVGRLGSLAGPAFAALLLAAGRPPQQILTSVLPIVVACGLCIILLTWRKPTA